MKEGEISKSMGVNTKPAHRLEFKECWILVDPKMSEKDLEKLKRAILELRFCDSSNITSVEEMGSTTWKPKLLWYRCRIPYKDFVQGRYYQLEIHGEPSPQIQVAFDLRHGYEINPNIILGQ